MKLFLIGCEVILRELSEALSRSPHLVDVKYLSKGLHDLGGKAMRKQLQLEIDAVAPDSYDAILLGYGLCGNGLAALEARTIPLIVPRAHDCITLLLGSRERFAEYFRAHPGVYYRSIGWLERGGDLEPLMREQTGAGMTLDALVEQYGEDNGRYLYEELTRYRQAYSQLTYIKTGLEPDHRFEEQARAEAAKRGWSFEIVDGSLNLFRELLAGNWTDRDFLVVPPGERLVVTHDDQIISTESLIR